MGIGELDVLRLRDGQEATVLEIFTEKNGLRAYLVENAQNETFRVLEQDVGEIVWKLPQPERSQAERRPNMQRSLQRSGRRALQLPG